MKPSFHLHKVLLVDELTQSDGAPPGSQKKRGPFTWWQQEGRAPWWPASRPKSSVVFCRNRTRMTDRVFQAFREGAWWSMVVRRSSVDTPSFVRRAHDNQLGTLKTDRRQKEKQSDCLCRLSHLHQSVYLPITDMIFITSPLKYSLPSCY